MPESRPSYPSEYRRKIVALVRPGRNAHELANEFECSAQTICNRAAQAELDEGQRAAMRISTHQCKCPQCVSEHTEAAWASTVTAARLVSAFNRCVPALSTTSEVGRFTSGRGFRRLGCTRATTAPSMRGSMHHRRSRLHNRPSSRREVSTEMQDTRITMTVQI